MLYLFFKIAIDEELLKILTFCDPVKNEIFSQSITKFQTNYNGYSISTHSTKT